MSAKYQDLFGTKTSFETGDGFASFFKLEILEKNGIGSISNMPFSIKVLLESVLRNCNNYDVTEEAVKSLANWDASVQSTAEVHLLRARNDGIRAFIDTKKNREATQKKEKRIPQYVSIDKKKRRILSSTILTA